MLAPLPGTRRKAGGAPATDRHFPVNVPRRSAGYTEGPCAWRAAAVTPGYRLEDIDLSGVVKYTGAGNHRDRTLVTIGGSVPTAVRTQQLP